MTRAESIKKQAEDVVDGAAYSPWMERLARFGFATKGFVYIVVGALAMQVAIGLGGRATDPEGALRQIELRPFGKVSLAAVAFGLVGYVLWRFIQAFADTEHEGKKLKGVLTRGAYFFSGVVYGSLAVTAAKALIDVAEPDSSSKVIEEAIAGVLTMPLGSALVVGGGGFVIGFGLYQIYKGLIAKFRNRLKLSEMTKAEDRLATWIGRVGYAARGVVFCIIGFFIIRAALDFDPDKSKGVDQVLRLLAQNSFGVWLLGAVAVGLIAYGFFMFVEARYRRIAGS